MSGLNLKSRVNLISEKCWWHVLLWLLLTTVQDRPKIQPMHVKQREREHSQAVAKVPHQYNTNCGQAVAIARCAKLAWVFGVFLGVFFLGGGSWTIVKKVISRIAIHRFCACVTDVNIIMTQLYSVNLFFFSNKGKFLNIKCLQVRKKFLLHTRQVGCGDDYDILLPLFLTYSKSPNHTTIYVWI